MYTQPTCSVLIVVLAWSLSTSMVVGEVPWSVKGTPGTIVFAAVGPGKDPADRVPLVIIRRHAQQTVYDCRHEFGVK